MADRLFTCPGEGDRRRFGEIVTHGFGTPYADSEGWFERAGVENLRVLRHGDEVVAGLVQVPLGQFFGGRSVPTLGIQGVGVAVTARGAGVGTALMKAALREARTRGTPLSTLYPASIQLYRRVGYERAGARFEISFDPRTIEARWLASVEKDVRIEETATPPSGSEPSAELIALYTSIAGRLPGFVDRSPYLWGRAFAPRHYHGTKTFGVRAGGRLEGYVVVAHKLDGHASKLLVTDLVASTARAAHAILRMLVEYRSVCTNVSWYGSASDVFASLLPERHHTIDLTEFFMLRVVDVVGALSARGWPKHLAPEASAVVLDVDDRSLPENSGIFRLRVQGGLANVERVQGNEAAGLPRISLNERALATLYSGHTSPFELARTGWLDGDEDGLERLEALFAGPAPSIRDFF